MVIGQQVQMSTRGFICMAFCVISPQILLFITAQVKQTYKFSRVTEIWIYQRSNHVI